MNSVKFWNKEIDRRQNQNLGNLDLLFQPLSAPRVKSLTLLVIQFTGRTMLRPNLPRKLPRGRWKRGPGHYEVSGSSSCSEKAAKFAECKDLDRVGDIR